MDRQPDDSGLAEELITSMLATTRLLVAISARALASIDETLTATQLRALVVLDSCGPAKLAALASGLGVNPSTALRTVDRLESLGLVDRRVNPDSRREVVLRVTDRGAEVVARVVEYRRAEISVLVDRLPAEVRAGLARGLRALTAVADEPDLRAAGPSGAGPARVSDVLAAASGEVRPRRPAR
ncbi:MarR family transcriptional regulator [Streptomyces bingchenggensis BCW-1]|uniref:MarR family transcriptional regulator n=1 Tax=Streptomyces bingchenggensis (strain BCW-1) TaxID=749414 RepID=D7CGK5_STRBB|nr:MULTISPECIES: MarR family transcriptional regulator [Streptomyces]ADI11085.1 MarR family transcriptional regulator [Streptomyces bingchenggensis BCW-1]